MKLCFALAAAAFCVYRGEATSSLRVAKQNLTVAAPPPTPAEEARAKARDEHFVLQYVGLADNELEPRNPMDKIANRCMIAIGRDLTQSNGYGLSFGECPHFMKKSNYGVPLGSEKTPTPDQLFQFLDDGRIMSVANQMCVRRTRCAPKNAPPPEGDRLWLYDLAACEDNEVAKFEVQKSRANRADIRIPKGDPLSVVANVCQSCGPFYLQQVCKGSCEDKGVNFGWTKPNSQAIPPSTKADTMRVYKNPAPYLAGLCDSYVSDEEGSASWWYFQKYEGGGTIQKGGESGG